MNSSRNLIKTLMAAEFDINLGTITVPLAQPFWVNADRTELSVTFGHDNVVGVELSFIHQQTLLKFGDDIETVGSMKDLCASEWFPDLERGFNKLSEYFNLMWRKEGEDLEFEWPWISYCLYGSFKPPESDRIVALLLEIRSVLD